MTAGELISARTAMVYAVDAAGRHEAADAQAWVAIARELRIGDVRAPRPAPDRLTLHDVEGIVCAHGRVAIRRAGGPGEWYVHTDDGSTCDDANPADEYTRRTSAATQQAWRDAATGQSYAINLPEPAAAYRGMAEPTTTASDIRESETTRIMSAPLRSPFVDQPPRYVEGPDSLPICGHCRASIYRSGSAVSGGMPAADIWRHIATDQAVCPTPVNAAGEEDHRPGTAHTFAYPLVAS